MTLRDRSNRNERPSDTGECADPPERTIEAFVARLHGDGVEAGRKEADRLVDEARREGEELLRRARVEADRIIAEAEARAERDLRRGRAELELAARDAVLALAAVLSRGMRATVEHAVQDELRDATFLRRLLTEVVRAYARDDASGAPLVRARVPVEMGEELEAWARVELARELGRPGALALSATLEEAGFEYRVGEGTVEVTVGSAGDLLMRFLTPRLRAALERAVREPRDDASAVPEAVAADPGSSAAVGTA